MKEKENTYQHNSVVKDDNGYESPVRHSTENIYVQAESIYDVVAENNVKEKTSKSKTATIWKAITIVLTVFCFGFISWVMILILKNCPSQQLPAESQSQCRTVPRCSGTSVYNALFNETCCINMQNFTANWDGFFYHSSAKQQMNMSVTFYETKITGRGSDPIDNFKILGNWNRENGIFQFVKLYPNSNVTYQGHIGGNLCSMSGNWTLQTGSGVFTMFTKLC